MALPRLLAWLVFATVGLPSFAGVDPPGQSAAEPVLRRAVTHAAVILLADVVSFRPDEPPARRGEERAWAFTGPAVAGLPYQPAGTYRLAVTGALRGQTERQVEVVLPGLSSVPFGGRAGAPIRDRTRVIVFLRPAPGRGWTPADAALPLFRVADDAVTGPPSDDPERVWGEVLRIVTNSWRQPDLALANSDLTKGIRDERLAVAAESLALSPSPPLRDNALYTLLVNERWSAIELARLLSRRLLLCEESIGSSCQALTVLGALRRPEVVPALNQLLFEPSRYCRRNALDALTAVPTRSSLPYALLGIYDPEPDLAYRCHRLCAQLLGARAADYGQFIEHREATSRTLFELHAASRVERSVAGAQAPADERRASLRLPNEADALAPLLLGPGAVTRRAALKRLAGVADRDSVPYLLLATWEQDAPFAAAAYRLLTQVLPEVHPVAAATDFAASPDRARAPFLVWWQDELSRKHLPPVPPELRPW